MKITEIKVRYGRTHSLTNYANVRPEVEYTVELGDDDQNMDRITVNDLMTQAKEFVHKEIDRALEDNYQPPKFYTGPRFKAGFSHIREAIAIVPQETELPPDFYYRPSAEQMRLIIIEEIAREMAKNFGGYLVYDCSSGDITELLARADIISEVDNVW
jgi:hypothetical protein